MHYDLVQQEFAHLIRVGWIVLIPAGVLLSMVLYKVVMLLHNFLSFFTLAQYEMAPALKDLRRTAEHVEELTSKAVTGVRTVESGVGATGSAIRSASKSTAEKMSSFWEVLKTTFH